MTTNKIYIVIDRYDGDIRSTPKYRNMLMDNIPDGYEVVFVSDKDCGRGMGFDQVWFDEFASMQIKEVQSEHRPVKARSKQYWQKGRWG